MFGKYIIIAGCDVLRRASQYLYLLLARTEHLVSLQLPTSFRLAEKMFKTYCSENSPLALFGLPFECFCCTLLLQAYAIVLIAVCHVLGHNKKKSLFHSHIRLLWWWIASLGNSVDCR